MPLKIKYLQSKVEHKFKFHIVNYTHDSFLYIDWKLSD